MISTDFYERLWDFSGLKKWENYYQHGSLIINTGKKSRHSLEILASLVLHGPLTTREMAKNILQLTKDYPYYHKPKDFDSRKLENIYAKLIEGRLDKKSGRKKLSKKYPGLVEYGYLLETGIHKNEKSKYVKKYFVTLRGCFVALGFDFNDSELTKFLQNTSKNHLFFAYINHILEITSIDFIKQIFIKPIYDLIKKKRINPDDEIEFYFTNIAESIGSIFYNKVTSCIEKFHSDSSLHNFLDTPGVEEIEKVMDNNFVRFRKRKDWNESIIDYFYHDSKDVEFYNLYYDEMYRDPVNDSPFDMNFLFKVMEQLHIAYYGADGIGMVTTVKHHLPRSKTSRRQWYYKNKHKK